MHRNGLEKHCRLNRLIPIHIDENNIGQMEISVGWFYCGSEWKKCILVLRCTDKRRQQLMRNVVGGREAAKS